MARKIGARPSGPQACPHCGYKGRVLETRDRLDHRYRRYECATCGVRWTTDEALRWVIGRGRRGPALKEGELGVWA